ncbi:MAG: DsrE family protein [Novosphingobium sp.]|nr:DsrE family protein [Novosphingobium sp.]
MNVLFILNHPPYDTEHCFNALRLAAAMAKKAPEVQVTVFLMADSVLCAKAGQKTPDGCYNIERMLKHVLTGLGQVLLCGVCMDARGLAEDDIVEGARRSTMDELAENTLQADKVLVF